MARGIRVIVLNCDESYTPELRAKLLKNDGVKIVAEVDEPALFQSALEQFPAELVVVNLDADPEGLTALGSEIIHEHPELCLFAISASSDSDLILQAMRAGFREFLLWPIDDEQLSVAVGRLAQTTPTQGPSGKLICVVGPTGGCGATTLTANLGCELAQLTRKGVVMVDLDFAFGHLSTLLDVSPQFSIADLCQTLEAIDPSMVEKALIKHDSGAMVLARPQHFAQAEQISAANTANVMNLLCEMFEYVICDGPSRYDAASPAILDLADMTIMVLNMIVPSVRNVDRILQSLGSQGYNMDRLHLIVNRYAKEAAMLDVDDIEECLSRKIEFALPEDAKSVMTAINMGKPLMNSAPKSRIRDAIQHLAKTIHDPEAAENDQANRQGLLARMFSK